MIGLLIKAFAPVHKRIRFLSEEDELDGCELLDRSGGAEFFGEGLYGVFSERQIRLLEEKEIAFEIVKEEERK